MTNQFFEQLKHVQELNLPPSQYLIWGSGPLTIRGIRESQDIDLLVSKSLWTQFSEKYPPSTQHLIRIGNIEMWNDCLNLTPLIDEMLAHPDIIDGLPFMRLTDTIEWKRFMNRDKDIKDIALIQHFLKMNQQLA